MQPPEQSFNIRASKALSDTSLQTSIAALKSGFVAARARAVAALPEF